MSTEYDQVSRWLVRRAPVVMMPWLLRLAAPAELDFVGWLDTRRLPWPSQPPRICDTVAWLRHLGMGGAPFAVVVEFQLDPDHKMPARLLVYLGGVLGEYKPSDHAGDTFTVVAVVVNLRGQGRSSRDMHWRGARARTVIEPVEWNLAEEDALATVEAVAAGRAPRGVLAWPGLFGGWRSGTQEGEGVARVRGQVAWRRRLVVGVDLAQQVHGRVPSAAGARAAAPLRTRQRPSPSASPRAQCGCPCPFPPAPPRSNGEQPWPGAKLLLRPAGRSI